jgi:transcription termination factor Rho
MATKKEKIEQLNSLTLKDLKSLCKDRKYEKYSKLKKDEIIMFIIEMEETSPLEDTKHHKVTRQFRRPNRSLRGF